MSAQERFMGEIRRGSLFITKHYHCDGSITYRIERVDRELVMLVSQDYWCHAIAFFQVVNRFEKPCGCVVEIVNPTYTPEDRTFSEIPF